MATGAHTRLEVGIRVLESIVELGLVHPWCSWKVAEWLT
jgi:hypothetical protein